MSSRIAIVLTQVVMHGMPRHRQDNHDTALSDFDDWILTIEVLQVNDGSSIVGLQVVVTEEAGGWQHFLEGRVSTGAAVCVKGQLVQSPGGKQSVRSRSIAAMMPCVIIPGPLLAWQSWSSVQA